MADHSILPVAICFKGLSVAMAQMFSRRLRSQLYPPSNNRSFAVSTYAFYISRRDGTRSIKGLIPSSREMA